MAKSPSSASKTLSRRVLVLIKRGITSSVSRVVWQHEVPVLEVMHGEGNVTQPDPQTMDEGFRARPTNDMLVHKPAGFKQEDFQRPSVVAGIGFVFHGDPRAEYERLAALYGKKADKDELIIENIYGRFQDGKFESMVGGASVSDFPEAQLRSILREHGAVPDTTKDSTQAEKVEVGLARAAFAKLTREELVTMVEDLAVVA